MVVTKAKPSRETEALHIPRVRGRILFQMMLKISRQTMKVDVGSVTMTILRDVAPLSHIYKSLGCMR